MATSEEQADLARANAIKSIDDGNRVSSPSLRAEYYARAEIYAKIYHADVLRGA